MSALTRPINSRRNVESSLAALRVLYSRIHRTPCDHAHREALYDLLRQSREWLAYAERMRSVKVSGAAQLTVDLAQDAFEWACEPPEGYDEAREDANHLAESDIGVAPLGVGCVLEHPLS